MRTIILLLSLTILAACGKKDLLPFSIAKSIGAEETGDIKKLKKDVDNIQERLEKIESDLAQMEQNIVNQGAENSANLEALKSELELAISEGDQDAADNLAAAVQTLENQITASQNTMQAQYNSLVVRLVELESEERMTEIVDPCPSISATFREVIIRTSSGKVFGYFENGNKRFLSVLSPGTYRTTDSRGCIFTI